MENPVWTLVKFIGILVALGIVWFVTGGPQRMVSHEGPYLIPPTPSERGYGYGPQFTLNSNVGLGSNTGSVPGKPQSEYTSNTVFTRNEITLYASNAYSTDPKTEYLTFSIGSQNVSPILLTGMRVESAATGLGTSIPQGTVLPFLGQVNVKEPIYAKPGDTVYVSTGRSPIGVSFRVNKCLGYFEQFLNFTPNISLQCPLMRNEPYPPRPNNFNDQCLDFIENLPRCEIWNRAYPDGLTHECRAFIDKNMNYQACVTAHKDDADFYKPELRIYLDQDQELWKSRREIIELRDRNGNKIDAVTY